MLRLFQDTFSAGGLRRLTLAFSVAFGCHIDLENRELLRSGAEILGDEFEFCSTESDSLINSVRYVLAFDEAYFSFNALKDLSEIEETSFGPASAISVCDRLGYVAKFGRFKHKRLKSLHCPFIAFSNDKKAMVIEEVGADGSWRCKDPSVDFAEKLISKRDLRGSFSEYVILVKSDKEVQSGAEADNWFFSSFQSSKMLYFNVFIGTALANVLALASAFFMMVVYDRIVPNNAIESLIALTVGVLVALSLEFIVKLFNSHFTDRAGKKADAKVSNLMFDRILNLRLDIRDASAGHFSGLVREFDVLRDFFTSATLIAVVNVPFVFFFIWVISLISGPLSVVPLVCVLAIMFLALVVQPLLNKYAKSSLASSFSKQSVVIETLNGLETIQASGSGGLMRRRFESAVQLQAKANLVTRSFTQAAVTATQTVIQLNMIGTIVYGVFLVDAEVMTMGAMIAAVLLGSRALAPLSSLTSAMSRASAARQAYKSINDLLTNDKLVKQEGGAKLSRPALRGEIELHEVNFSYGESGVAILDGVSVKIPAGQKVAVMGRMGSGKSTFLRLLSGIISPSKGSIMIDGVDLSQIDPRDLRRNVGVMLQDSWLFSGSIRENIIMGFNEYNDDKVLKVSKLSGVDDFASKSSVGYDTKLKEGGMGLSGGQRQSINLARSLLHDPQILLLDEPTSAMDVTSEAEVLRRLVDYTKDKTVCIVTHRQSVLNMVDRVLIFNNGKIVADTTPDAISAKQKRAE